jgi:hypothetical protein
MQNGEKLTPQHISEFLKGSEEISFTAGSKAEVYSWVQSVLVAQEFASQSRGDRGSIRAYIEKVTGLSVPQATRLIRQYRETGMVGLQPARRLRFRRKYTDRDITLLAEVDRAHEWLSGPATRCILRREYEQFGKQQFARLAGISSAHLTICAGACAIARWRQSSNPHVRARCRSASAVGRIRKIVQGTCGWTRYTREIGTVSKVCTTSMPSMR